MVKTLRQWRLEKLMSTKELATVAGVSNKTVVQIEHGRQVPLLRTIRRISEALDVPPREVQEFAEALEALEDLEGKAAA
jgi:transcriptional regulator with XRE-family HTH domain